MARRKGRGRGGRNRQGGRKKSRDQNSDQRTSRSSWTEAWKDDFLEYKFGKYYKKLAEEYNMMDVSEWAQFEHTFRQPLPTTLRFSATSPYTDEIIRLFQEAFKEPEIIVDGKEETLLKPLNWFPKNMAWYTSLARRPLKRVPGLTNVHQALMALEDIGVITRQEAVSMIPPMFLDIQSHHVVLDMCAAPGSKTQQMIDTLCDTPNATPATGCIIANDVNRDRCYTLAHQTKRLSNDNCMIVNHEAQSLPQLRAFDPAGAHIGYIAYDRVLADVPCTGDGTLRKNGDALPKWNAGSAAQLHSLQLRIAFRGAFLLAVGGIMVYSTCSLNPIEDEAVVAELLRQCGGALELVDVSAQYPLLKRRKGINNWPFLANNDEYYESFADLQSMTTGRQKKNLWPSVFAGKDTQDFNLDRCMRFLPHDQNTGGFFVAVLRKTAEFDFIELDRSLVGALEHRVDTIVEIDNATKTEANTDNSAKTAATNDTNNDDAMQTDEKTIENVSKDEKTTENVSKDEKTTENVSNDEKTTENVSTTDVSSNTSTTSTKRAHNSDADEPTKKRAKTILPLVQSDFKHTLVRVSTLQETCVPRADHFIFSNNQGFPESPFHAASEELKTHFKKALLLKESSLDRLGVRTYEPEKQLFPKQVYMVSPSLSLLVSSGEARRALRVVSAGDKVFTKSNARSDNKNYRICGGTVSILRHLFDDSMLFDISEEDVKFLYGNTETVVKGNVPAVLISQCSADLQAKLKNVPPNELNTLALVLRSIGGRPLRVPLTLSVQHSTTKLGLKLPVNERQVLQPLMANNFNLSVDPTQFITPPRLPSTPHTPAADNVDETTNTDNNDDNNDNNAVNVEQAVDDATVSTKVVDSAEKTSDSANAATTTSPS